MKKTFLVLFAFTFAVLLYGCKDSSESNADGHERHGNPYAERYDAITKSKKLMEESLAFPSDVVLSGHVKQMAYQTLYRMPVNSFYRREEKIEKYGAPPLTENYAGVNDVALRVMENAVGTDSAAKFVYQTYNYGFEFKKNFSEIAPAMKKALTKMAFASHNLSYISFLAPDSAHSFVNSLRSEELLAICEQQCLPYGYDDSLIQRVVARLTPEMICSLEGWNNINLINYASASQQEKVANKLKGQNLEEIADMYYAKSRNAWYAATLSGIIKLRIKSSNLSPEAFYDYWDEFSAIVSKDDVLDILERKSRNYVLQCSKLFLAPRKNNPFSKDDFILLMVSPGSDRFLIESIKEMGE